MTCWGATRECFRNCCGGPHSEHYDAWLARERLRQLNAQTQKVDQLTRENTILGTALAQSQDILSSYQEVDAYETEGQPQYSAAVPAMTPARSGRLPATPIQRPSPVSISRQSSSSGGQLPPVRSSIRRQDLVPPKSSAQRPPSPTLRPYPSQGIAEADPSTPRMRMASQQTVGSRRATIAMVDNPSFRTSQPPETQLPRTQSLERQAITANLRMPLPYVAPLPPVKAQPALPQTDRPKQGHPSTHGYSPDGPQARPS